MMMDLGFPDTGFPHITITVQGSEFEVFLLSTRAGGLGLNLQTAGVLIRFGVMGIRV